MKQYGLEVRRLVVVATCLLTLLPFSSLCAKDPLAWNDPGHRLTALIAFEVMSEAERKTVIELLKQHPRFEEDFGVKSQPKEIQLLDDGAQKERALQRWMFGQAAVWPDIARGFPETERVRYHRWSWHFINRPIARGFWRSKKKIPLSGSLDWTPKDELRALNVVQALKMCRHELQSGKKSAAKRAVLLCWYFHLIGDLHQPLHAASLYTPKLFLRGDKGGNEIKFGPKMNLHRFWDNAMSKARTVDRLDRESSELMTIEEREKYGRLAARNLNFEDWMRESHPSPKRRSIRKR